MIFMNTRLYLSLIHILFVMFVLISTPTWAASVNSVVFTQSNSFITIDGTIPVDQSLTVEANIYFLNQKSTNQFNWVTQWHGLGHIGQQQFDFSTNYMDAYMYPKDTFNYNQYLPGSDGNFYTTNVSISLSDWHSCAYVLNQTNESFFLDGKKIASRSTSSAKVYSPSTWHFITGFCGLGSFKISKVVLYTNDYSPNYSSLNTDTNTLLLYNFTNSSGGAIVTDLSGNGHTGHLGGRPIDMPPAVAPIYTNFLAPSIPVLSTNSFYYTTNSSSASIIGYSGTNAAVSILSSISGLPVTSIGDGAFTNQLTITSIIIPSGVTNIGVSAFSGCSNLVSITIPDSVTQFGSGMFTGCSSLTNITASASVLTFLSSNASNLGINQRSQTISFPALANTTYSNGLTINLGATASSGLSVSYTSPNTNIVTISGSKLTLLGSGSASIVATQAGNWQWLAAPPVTNTLVISALPAITLNGTNVTVIFKNNPYVDLGASATDGTNSAIPLIGTGSVDRTVAGTNTITYGYTNSKGVVALPVTRKVVVVDRLVRGTSCYTIVPGPTWEEAESQSQQLGGHLATVTNGAENDFLVQSFVGKSGERQGLWIGLTDKGHEGVWTWSSGDTSSYRNWCYYEPNGSTNENCVHMWSGNPWGYPVGSWNDIGNLPDNGVADSTGLPKLFRGIAKIPISLPSITLNDTNYMQLNYGSAFTDPMATVVDTVDGTKQIVGTGSVDLFTIGSYTLTYGYTNSLGAVANTVTRTVVINQGSQTITFDPILAKTYGDSPFKLNATSSSGLPVTYSYFPSGNIYIDSNTVTIVGVGSVSVKASQEGNSNYARATPVTQNLLISKASNVIVDVYLITPVSIGVPPFAISATSSSGLPVSFSSSSTNISIAGNTVTILGTGTAIIVASQSGNSNYIIAPSVTNSLVVNGPSAGLKAQTISIPPLKPKSWTNAPFALTAKASSKLPITYTSSDPTVATVSGGILTPVGVGTTTITAYQGGNSIYSPATPVSLPQVITQAGQKITFAPIAPHTYGDAPFVLSASSSSSLPITFVSSATNVATVSGNVVTIVGAGTAKITASQSGNTLYTSAPSVTQALKVAKANQTVTFNPATPVTYTNGGTVNFNGTASSGLPLTYKSSAPKVITVLTGLPRGVMIGRGATTITAAQAGDANYNKASATSSITLQ